MPRYSDDFSHPYDTLVSASLRFLSELVAWVAGPWAMATLSTWLVLPALVILVGLPSVFSTRNDKRQVVVPTPGPARAGLELVLYLVAAVAPWFIWPATISGVAVAVVIASLVLGAPRIRWLLRGAPEESENEA